MPAKRTDEQAWHQQLYFLIAYWPGVPRNRKEYEERIGKERIPATHQEVKPDGPMSFVSRYMTTT